MPNNLVSGNLTVARIITITDTINQGDIMRYDSGTGTDRVAGSDSDMSTMTGVAMDSFPAAAGVDQPSGVTGTPVTVPVRRAGIFNFIGKLSDSFTNGLPVYWSVGGTGAQQLTITPGSNIVGYVCLDSTTGAAIVGDGASYSIPVEIKPLYPATAIPIVS